MTSIVMSKHEPQQSDNRCESRACRRRCRIGDRAVGTDTTDTARYPPKHASWTQKKTTATFHENRSEAKSVRVQSLKHTINNVKQKEKRVTKWTTCRSFHMDRMACPSLLRGHDSTYPCDQQFQQEEKTLSYLLRRSDRS